MAGGFGMIEAHLRDKRILLVDDEQDLARMVGTILRGSASRSRRSPTREARRLRW